MEREFLLIPVHDDVFNIGTRQVKESELLHSLTHEKLEDALENGTEIIYKGNRFFLDLPLD